MKKKIVIGTVILAVMLAGTYGIYKRHTRKPTIPEPETVSEEIKKTEDYTERSEEETNNMDRQEEQSEESFVEKMMLGDPEENYEDYTLYDALEVPPIRATHRGFQEFMMEYALTQNYTKNGFNYSYADKAYESGISMNDSAARISGMGNTGYLVWVLRNTFGICSPDFENPITVYRKSPKILKEELQIGDLGFYSENEEDNFCAICVGFSDGEPIFSLMDGSRTYKFPFGTNRLAYLQSGTNEYIGESAPVRLQYFCRPELPWTDDMDAGMDLKGRIENESIK